MLWLLEYNLCVFDEFGDQINVDELGLWVVVDFPEMDEPINFS
jgi:hypothetical protein